MSSFFGQLVDFLEALSGSPWFYVAIVMIAFLDSVIPLVPSETTVILGGAAAAAGELSLPLVLILAATGAFMGDSAAYTLGSQLGASIQRLIFRGPKGPERVSSLHRQISKRGGLLLITARFIPGGRTALTLTCGLTQQPYTSWFARWDFIAVVIWASYAGGLGFFFGQWFDHGTAFLLAFSSALTFTLAVELVQRVKAARQG